VQPADLGALPLFSAPFLVEEEEALEEIDEAMAYGDIREAAFVAADAWNEGLRHPAFIALVLPMVADMQPEQTQFYLHTLRKECGRRDVPPLPEQVGAWLRRRAGGEPEPGGRDRARPKLRGSRKGRKGRPARPARRRVTPSELALLARRARARAKAASASATSGRRGAGAATDGRRAAARQARPKRDSRDKASKPADARPLPTGLAFQVSWLPETPPVVPAPGVEFRFEPGDVVDRAGAGLFDGVELVGLAGTAVELLRARHFDELLALGHVRGITSFPHQVETARRVLRDFGGKALLADEVGLGKTVEAGLIAKEYILRGLVRSVLVLCPPSLVQQWRAEMASKFGLCFEVPGKDPAGFFDSGDLLLCSLSFARREEHARRATARRFDMVIVDEAHHVKNRRTLGFRLVDRLKRKFMLLLTATPVQNQLDELFNLVTLLRPGHLGTRGAFGRDFVTRGDRRRPQDKERLRALLAEVMIRNTRALVDVRLPPRFVRTVSVEPSEAERELYAALSEYVRDRGRGEPGRSRALLLTLLMQAGSSPAAVLSTLDGQLASGRLAPELEAPTRALQVRCMRVQQTAKAAVLLDLIEQAGGDKIAVFVKYLATLATLEGLLRARGVPVAVFHGGLSAREKQRAIDGFAGELPVLLSTEIGGEGRNLQFCRRLVNFDLPWNPFAIEQRIGRLHRIGQEREVHVVNLCARGTAEDYLLGVLDEKLNMFELVIGELDMILGDRESDLDIPGRVFSIWTETADEVGRRAGFDQLGQELEQARHRHAEACAYDEALFGRNYEVT